MGSATHITVCNYHSDDVNTFARCFSCAQEFVSLQAFYGIGLGLVNYRLLTINEYLICQIMNK